MSNDDDRGLDPVGLITRISGGKSELRCHKGQMLYAQGEPAEFAYYFHSGLAKMAIVSPEGGEAVVGILRSGDLCGEAWLPGAGSHTATVTTLSECVVTRVEKASMIRAISNDAAFAQMLISYLTTCNIRMQADLTYQRLESAEKRLARLLLTLVGHDTGEGLVPTAEKISQETLAEAIGTTRTRVNFFMNRFRRLGFIDYNGEIMVHRLLLERFLRG